MIIGKFSPTIYGSDVPAREDYAGDIWCREWRDLCIEIEPVATKQGNGPDFVVTAREEIDKVAFEIGAAWRKTSKAGKPYLSVKLDGPTLASPINCALTQATLSHAFHAVTACTVMVYAQYGMTERVPFFVGRLDNFVEITEVPRWSPADVYLHPYTSGTWTATLYPF